mgnify:CR=1 FL=1
MRYSNTKTARFLSRPNRFVAMVAIDGKAEQLVTHPQMRRVMKVMEACFESDRIGQVVKFEE